MNWQKINLDWIEPHVLGMELPACEPMQTATVKVLICYTVKDKFFGRVEKKYDIGWFDWDGDNWYCTLDYKNKDQVHEYLAYAEIEPYEG
ncbi:hypothetical protein [Hymenobacter latericus]|uniref:hypothetical protein n=1 Tax=Hymenobacter sp. YIM 151858-1 TaxID=2987688 RepID=UPI00222774C4|nr:hypothetical protein [Hymenobacter sp. YIM 151858-1]UYZ60092.1 hypothetical protein OIS50_04650 [Hymenobacter sp. YIM 151858-1]